MKLKTSERSNKAAISCVIFIYYKIHISPLKFYLFSQRSPRSRFGSSGSTMWMHMQRSCGSHSRDLLPSRWFHCFSYPGNKKYGLSRREPISWINFAPCPSNIGSPEFHNELSDVLSSGRDSWRSKLTRRNLQKPVWSLRFSETSFMKLRPHRSMAPFTPSSSRNRSPRTSPLLEQFTCFHADQWP